MKKRKFKKQTKLPTYCDYSCNYADFAPNDATGACRREQAVYCMLLERFNTKNAKCLGKTNQ